MRMRCRASVMLDWLLRGLLDDLRDKYANLCDSYANLRSTPANLRSTSTNLCDSHSNLRSVPANLRTGVLKSAGCQRPCWRTERWNIKETTILVWQIISRVT